MHRDPQTDASLGALRRAIEADDDAEIVRLYTASEADDFGALTRQEHVRVDLAIRRVNNRRAIRTLVPYAVGALVVLVVAIVAVIVIVPRLLSRPAATPGVPVAAATTPPFATHTPDPALAGAQGRAVSQKRTPTRTSVPPTSTPTLLPTPSRTPAPSPTPTRTSVPPTNTPTNTPVPTHTPTYTPVPTNTHTPSPVPTHTPTSTQTPTPTSTHTPVPSPTPTRTSVAPTRTSVAPTRTPVPTPTTGLRPAPRLEAPPNGTNFSGWNAEVILRWSSVGTLAADEYYVVRIPYDDAGGVAEFWRKETMFKVPPHFSGRNVGFPDRHYNWTVQAMRCTENCASVTDDNVRKGGRATSARSAEGLFYWHPDIGGGAPGATPTRD